jgi:hypothetical protein
MATDYAGQYAASHPGAGAASFSQRMEMAIVKNAGFIYNESASTPGHAARAFYASQMVKPGAATNNAPAWVEQCAVQGFACDGTTTDLNIDGVLSSEWNLMANA